MFDVEDIIVIAFLAFSHIIKDLELNVTHDMDFKSKL